MLRRITEALEAKQTDGGGDAVGTDEEMPDNDVTTETAGDADTESEPTPTTDLTDIKLTKLAIPELQERYRQAIGRDTRSTSAA